MSFPAVRSRGRREIRLSLSAFSLAAMLTFVVAPGFAQTAPAAPQMNMPPVEPASSALPTGRAREIANQVMCTCGCGDTAGSCSHPGAAFSGPCEVAKGKLKEINERVGRGESNASILQTLVKEYGEAVLAAPPVSGFNWFAYRVPGRRLCYRLGIGHNDYSAMAASSRRRARFRAGSFRRNAGTRAPPNRARCARRLKAGLPPAWQRIWQWHSPSRYGTSTRLP